MIFRCFVTALAVSILFVLGADAAGKDAFQAPTPGENFGIWQITDDPTVRDHANYHNTQCWSPDGRYLCYTRWGGESPGTKGSAEVHLYDLSEDADRLLGDGFFPRWSKNRNDLFYVRYRPGPDNPRPGAQVVWVDVDSGRSEVLVNGPEMLGETDSGDRWLYGALRFRGRKPESSAGTPPSCHRRGAL